MRKVQALLFASRSDPILPKFKDEAAIVEEAVMDFLAKHASKFRRD